MGLEILVGAALIGGGVAASSHAQKKTAKRAQESADARQKEAIAEQRRVEDKFGITPAEEERAGRTFDLEKERQTELKRRADLSGEELLKELGPNTRALLDTVAARQGKTSEELFIEEGGRPAQLLLNEISQPGPNAAFAPELELVRQQVNAAANQRGVFGGEVKLENLGRAGVDLAVNASRERIAQRSGLANQLFNISAGARQEAGQVGTQALAEQERSRSEIEAFLSNLQNLEQSSKQRAATTAVQAQGTAAQQIQQSEGLRQSAIGLRGAAETAPGKALSGIGSGLLTSGFNNIQQAKSTILPGGGGGIAAPGSESFLLTGGKRLKTLGGQQQGVPQSTFTDFRNLRG